MTITINAKLLHAITKWTHSDYDRAALRCVLFQHNKVVACDGHRLVSVPVDADDQEFCIDRSHVLAAIAAHKEAHGGNDIEITVEDKRARITIGQLSLIVPMGRVEDYPPYKQVMPGAADGLPSGYYFQSKYLAAIDEVHVALGGGSTGGVKVVAWSADRLGPMRFEGAGGSEFVIMPMRA